MLHPLSEQRRQRASNAVGKLQSETRNAPRSVQYAPADTLVCRSSRTPVNRVVAVRTLQRIVKAVGTLQLHSVGTHLSVDLLLQIRDESGLLHPGRKRQGKISEL